MKISVVIFYVLLSGFSSFSFSLSSTWQTCSKSKPPKWINEGQIWSWGGMHKAWEIPSFLLVITYSGFSATLSAHQECKTTIPVSFLFPSFHKLSLRCTRPTTPIHQLVGNGIVFNHQNLKIIIIASDAAIKTSGQRHNERWSAAELRSFN